MIAHQLFMGWSIVADFEVKFDGMDELIKHIEEVGKMKEAKAIVKETTVNVARKSQELVPVGYGERYPVKSKKPAGYVGGTLKRSQKVTITDYTGMISFNTDYAAYQEYGTRFQTARKYLGTPFIKERNSFIAKLKRLAK
jgi:HK97 gp10 family phage protein